MSTESKLKPLTILLPLSAAVELKQLQTLSSKIIEITNDKPVGQRVLLLSTNKLDRDGTPTRLGYANEVAKSINRSRTNGFHAEVLPIDHKGGDVTDAGGGRYVQGFYEAAQIAGDNGLVAEIDSRCHRTEDLSVVIDKLLDNRPVVMSTRFFMKGAENHFPLGRQASSLFVTAFGNLFGRPGMFIPDLASGLDGYSGELLNTIYRVRPHQDWITMRTFTMFINTELRLYILWTLQQRHANLKKSVDIVPIVYAKGIPGKNFGASEAKKALTGLIELVSSRGQFIRDLESITTQP